MKVNQVFIFQAVKLLDESIALENTVLCSCVFQSLVTFIQQHCMVTLKLYIVPAFIEHLRNLLCGV